MSTPSKFIKVVSNMPKAQSAVGYAVISDYMQAGMRVIVLERPETGQSAPVARKPRRKAATPPAGSNAQETASQEVGK